MTEDADLDRFQSALLDLLAATADVDEIRRRLATDPAFAPYAEYVAEFEPRMLDVAQTLIKRWGRRVS